MTRASSGRALASFSLEHTGLRLTRRPVMGTPEKMQSVIRPSSPAATLPAHRNWLPRAAYSLASQSFAGASGSAAHNLIDLVAQAARRVVVDDVVVVRPIGSFTYARSAGVLNWDLVRDLDVWVFVSAETIASDGWRELHTRLQRHVFEVLAENRIATDLSDRTGYVHLNGPDGKRRMVELKIADLGWLREGIQYAHLRRANLPRWPRPAHFDVPRLEWAAYTPHENYFAIPEAEQAFVDAVTSIGETDALYCLRQAYAENLAEAFRVLTPRRIFRAVRSQRLFAHDVSKVLKKQLVLAVMLGNETARRNIVTELEKTMDRDAPSPDFRARGQYLAECARNLQMLRTVDPQVFSVWVKQEAATRGLATQEQDAPMDLHESIDLTRAMERVHST
jgi:hypothetical protein